MIETVIVIGVDPGVSTGIAVGSTRTGLILQLSTMKLHRAFDEIKRQVSDAEFHKVGLKLYVEDARKIGGHSGKWRGAGSIMRDCKAWEDFCIDYKIAHEFTTPSKYNNLTKAQFETYTNCKLKGSTHARDAAMIIWINCLARL